MKLDDEQRELRRIFAQEVEGNLEAFIARYRKEFGNYLCTDNALELCEKYRKATVQEKARYVVAIQGTASRLVKAVYEQMLWETPQHSRHSPYTRRNTVAFISGGMASGKSTVIDRAKDKFFIIYEVVKGLSEEKIEKAFSHGKDVAVLFVYRPVEQAVRSLITRSEQIGRTPKREFFVEGHYQAQQILFKQIAAYGNRANFFVSAIDNRGSPDQYKVSSIDLVRKNAYRSVEEIKQRIEGVLRYVYRERQKRGRPIPRFIIDRLFSYEFRRIRERSSPDHGRRWQEKRAARSRSPQARRALDRTGGGKKAERVVPVKTYNFADSLKVEVRDNTPKVGICELTVYADNKEERYTLQLPKGYRVEDMKITQEFVRELRQIDSDKPITIQTIRRREPEQSVERDFDLER